MPPEGLFLGDERVSPFQNRQRLRLGLFRFQGFLDLGRDEGVLALVHKVLLLVLLAQFLQKRFIFAGDFRQAGFQRRQSGQGVRQQNLLHQSEWNDMTGPALLHLLIFAVLLFRNHVGVNLFCGSKSLRLDNFEVNRNPPPFVIQKLIGAVAIDQRNPSKPGENGVAQHRFLLGGIEGLHFAQQLGPQQLVKVMECGFITGEERGHRRVRPKGGFQFRHVQAAVRTIIRSEQRVL